MNPPTITAMTSADLAHDIVLTFTDDAAWRAAITNITVDGESCETNSYTDASGSITIQWRNFEYAMTSTITIEATGYDDASVSQVVGVAKWRDLTFFEVDDSTTYPITNDDLSDFESHFGAVTGRDGIHDIVRRFLGREIRKYWKSWEDTIREGQDDDSFNCLNYIKNPRILKETFIYYSLYRLFNQEAQDTEDMYSKKATEYKKNYGMERNSVLTSLDFETPVTDYEEDWKNMVRLVR